METETQEDTKDNSLTHVERLEKVALELKQENDRAEKIQLQQREAAALNELGGKTSAEPKEEVKEMSDLEYSKQALSGVVPNE